MGYGLFDYSSPLFTENKELKGMKRWPFVAIGLGFAAAVGWSRIQPRTVLAIGDSLTSNGGYCKALESRLPKGSLVFCVGYPGEGAKAIHKAVNLECQKGATDIIILVGVNDLASGRGTDEVMLHLNRLYQDARGTGARVIAVQLTPWGGHYLGKGLQKETAALNSAIYNSPKPSYRINTSALGKDGKLKPEYDSGDGLHLNKAGQDALGKMIYRQVF